MTYGRVDDISWITEHHNSAVIWCWNPRRDDMAEHIRHARKECGFTQAQLAEKSGVPIRLIRAYEQGAIDPMKGEFRTISALEKSLGTRFLTSQL